jgi:hypothetical protein
MDSSAGGYNVVFSNDLIQNAGGVGIDGEKRNKINSM